MAARDTTCEATDLLEGALRKVAMIAYYARELARVLDEHEPHKIALQAHFEGVLFAGISAKEKLVLALRSLVGGDVVADTSRLVRDLLGRQETEELGQRLARWLQSREEEKTLAEEARALRNAATHHFYDKRGGRHKPLLDACIERVTASLRTQLPGYGRDIAIDASDLSAYANGQRYLSKHGPDPLRQSLNSRRLPQVTGCSVRTGEDPRSRRGAATPGAPD